GSCTPRPKRTPTSRDTPRCDRQSGRLLVTSRSMAMSPSTSATSSRFSPAIINRSVRVPTGMSSRTYSFSQFQLTIMISLSLSLPLHGAGVMFAFRLGAMQDFDLVASLGAEVEDQNQIAHRHHGGDGRRQFQSHSAAVDFGTENGSLVVFLEFGQA